MYANTAHTLSLAVLMLGVLGTLPERKPPGPDTGRPEKSAQCGQCKGPVPPDAGSCPICGASV